MFLEQFSVQRYLSAPCGVVLVLMVRPLALAVHQPQRLFLRARLPEGPEGVCAAVERKDTAQCIARSVTTNSHE